MKQDTVDKKQNSEKQECYNTQNQNEEIWDFDKIFKQLIIKRKEMHETYVMYKVSPTQGLGKKTQP